MSATVIPESGSDAPRTVMDQFASALHDSEHLVESKTDHAVSDEEIDSIRELLDRTDRVLTFMTDARRGPHLLPTEILRIIFLKALRPVDLSRFIRKHIPLDSFPEGPGEDIDLGWPNEHMRVCDVLALAHVCQYWRSVALALPELWQSVHMSSPDAASTFLARAGDRPLSVLATATGPSDAAWFSDMYAKCAPTIRQLLWVSTSDRRPDLPYRKSVKVDLNIGSAPMLERLCIAAGTGDSGRSLDTVLRGDLSKLKYLSVISCYWFPQSHCPSLTHLILAERSITPWPLARRFLHSCPNLQTLICKTAGSWTELFALPNVTLPHLTRISLECAEFPDPVLLDFISKLDFDRSRAAIRVSYKGTPNQQRNLVVAPPGPQQATLGLQRRPDAAPYTHLCVEAVGPPHGPRSFKVFATSETGGVCLQGQLALYRFVQDNIPLQDVTELWVDGLTKDTEGVLQTCRRALSALRTVIVVRRPPPHGTEVAPLAPAEVVEGGENKVQRAWRGEEPIFGRDLASQELGRQILEQWDSEDAIFERLKAIFLKASVPGAHPVRMFVAGSMKMRRIGGREAVCEETRAAMLMPEVCREDPEFTAWEAW